MSILSGDIAVLLMTCRHTALRTALASGMVAVLLLVFGVQTVHAQRQGGAGAQGRSRDVLQGRGRGALATGTASIRGRVLSADTGTPVRRAQVRAVSGDVRSARITTTDPDGRFELRDLPAGRWMLSAAKGGYVTQQLGQRRPFESVEPLVLADGQRATADFMLIRGGVISGRVQDEYGDPVTGARVQVLRAQMAQGSRRLAPVGSAQTDDTGTFRVFGLGPGDYYVAGSLRAAPDDSPSGSVTYAPTYFPGTASVADAQKVALRPGEEQLNVNFVLQPVRAVRVSGTVIDSMGSPATGVVSLVNVSDADEGIVDGVGARARPDGTFTISNVVPGSYVLTVNGGRSGGQPELATMPLMVGNDDLTGVLVTLSRGGTVRGTVVAENGASLPAGRITVQARSQRLMVAAGPMRNRTAQTASSGSFELTGLLGPQTFHVEGVPPGWMLKSITVGGTDATDRPLEFRGNEQVTARVVLTDRVSEVNGTVRAGGAPALGATVILFADEPARWAFPSRYVRSVHASAQGTFSIRGIPAHDRYLAVAVDYVESGEVQDPEFLARLRSRGTAVAVKDATTATLDLTVVER